MFLLKDCHFKQNMILMLFHQLDITQLDGVADSSSDTEEDDDDEDLGLVGEEEFLEMINGNEEELEEEEVIKALAVHRTPKVSFTLLFFFRQKYKLYAGGSSLRTNHFSQIIRLI